MGRRALPKIKAGIDYSQILLELPKPLQSAANSISLSVPSSRVAGDRNDSKILPNHGRPDWGQFESLLRDFAGAVHLEIGSGKGHFLITESGAQPDALFVGAEISPKYARFAAYRCAQAGRDNVRVVCGDAIRFVNQHLWPESVDSVHVYFPDPWWKARHRKRRVVRPEFVVGVEQILKPHGRLHFWTDVEEYFHSGCEIVLANSALSGPFPVEPGAAVDHSFRTHFERRMKLHDLPVYRAEFAKM